MARVNCPSCEQKAFVTSREIQSAHVTHLYCSCSNSKDCGATFRVTIGFDHYLNPPKMNTAQMAADLLKLLPRNKQLELLGL